MTTEINPEANRAAAKAGGNGKRRKALAILATVIVVAGIAWLLYWVLVARWHEDTDDAYVQGNVVTVTPQVGGTVVGITVDDGMKVQAGQVLVRFDHTDTDVAYQQAVANLANTVRQVRGLYKAVDAGQADIAARRVALEQARADVARRSGLVASGAVSAEELAHAKAQLASAEAALSLRRKPPRAIVRWSTTARSRPIRRCRPPPRSCARPTSPRSARRSWRRCRATSPSATCSSASASPRVRR